MVPEIHAGGFGACTLVSRQPVMHSFRGNRHSSLVARMGSAHQTPRSRPFYEEITSTADASFARFYAIYADLFPLPDEREPPEAFERIRALNEDADMQKRLGPWREIVAGIRLVQDGPMIGGHVFGVTTSPAHEAFGCQASVQAIYTFFERGARGRGALEDAKRYMTEKALQTFRLESGNGSMPPLVFFEVNNPTRMTPAQIAEDKARSGLDPHRRYVFWKCNGFAPLDFSYVQPRLRPDAEPVRYLDLFCTAGMAGAIPVELLAAHLHAFVSFSVLKGRDASSDPDFASMAKTFRPGTMISFVDDADPEQQRIAMLARAARKS